TMTGSFARPISVVWTVRFSLALKSYSIFQSLSLPAEHWKRRATQGVNRKQKSKTETPIWPQSHRTIRLRKNSNAARSDFSGVYFVDSVFNRLRRIGRGHRKLQGG